MPTNINSTPLSAIRYFGELEDKILESRNFFVKELNEQTELLKACNTAITVFVALAEEGASGKKITREVIDAALKPHGLDKEKVRIDLITAISFPNWLHIARFVNVKDDNKRPRGKTYDIESMFVSSLVSRYEHEAVIDEIDEKVVTPELPPHYKGVREHDKTEMAKLFVLIDVLVHGIEGYNIDEK